jgi:hypothetical protein
MAWMTADACRPRMDDERTSTAIALLWGTQDPAHLRAAWQNLQVAITRARQRLGLRSGWYFERR